MSHILKKIVPRNTGKNDFSEFFHDASAGEKKRLFKEVIRKANEDQKALIDKYEKAVPKTA